MRDMLFLELKHRDFFQWFQSSKCIVFKSCRTSSLMAIDQAHEQKYAVIKGEDGAVGMPEDPSALRRWMVAGSEVSRLATEYEIVYGAKDTNEKVRQLRHNKMFEKGGKLYTGMKEIGNPLQEETADLVIRSGYWSRTSLSVGQLTTFSFAYS